VRLAVLLSELQHQCEGPQLRRVVDLAVQAERIGIDAVFFGEHVVMGPASDADGPPEPFAPLRPRRIHPAQPWLDPFVALGAVAGATETIGLGTAILIAPLRPPVLVATMAASLDVLSGGRLELGLGVSWQEAEYEALGQPFHRRGRALDDGLRLWRQLWTGAPVTDRAGDHVLDRITAGLRPVRGRIPLWFGGGLSPAMVRRLVAHGDGLAPLPRASAEELEDLRRTLGEAGRAWADIDLITGIRTELTGDGPGDLRASLRPLPGLVAQGYTTFVLWPGSYASHADELGDVMADARAEFDRLVDQPRATLSRS